MSSRGERERLGEADDLERIETDIDAARQRKVHFIVDQRVAGTGDGQQRRRTSAIDDVAAAAKIEIAADAAGDGVRHVAGQRIFGDFRQRAFVTVTDRQQKSRPAALRQSARVKHAADGSFHVGPAVTHVVAARKLAGKRIAQHHADAAPIGRVRSMPDCCIAARAT